ncbi:hypothetical protein I5I63_26595, partial [Pseudomonas aeruginosa]|nr:hypothetical protein [Pseudomonas aeruginosa]
LLLLTSGLSEPERQGIRSALEHRAARLAVLGVGPVAGAPGAPSLRPSPRE